MRSTTWEAYRLAQTTYKAFKVRLRLFFSDVIGCCEWIYSNKAAIKM